MHRYQLIENDVSDDRFANARERFSLSGEAVHNIHFPYGPPDPTVLEEVSARLAIGKTETIKQGGEFAGILLHLKAEDLATLSQAIMDSGYLQRKEAFLERASGLEGAMPPGKDTFNGMNLIVKGSSIDSAYREFYRDASNRFFELCLSIFTVMYHAPHRRYAFFLSS